MADHPTVAVGLGKAHGVEGLGQSADLIDLDEDRVGHALVDRATEEILVGDEKIITNELHPIAESFRDQAPALPVVLGETVFDRQDGYEAFVVPEQLPGLTIEFIQSHDRSWVYPSEAIGEPISSVMNLIRLHHFGLVVENLQDACKRFEQVLGLSAQDFRDDQGKGMQYDARILLPNHCWLHLVQNWNPEARVNRFLQSRGQGLDHIAVQTTDIQADVTYLRDHDIPVFKDEILNAADGFESFVYPDQLPGMTVELIEPHAHSWSFPEEAFPSRTD